MSHLLTLFDNVHKCFGMKAPVLDCKVSSILQEEVTRRKQREKWKEAEMRRAGRRSDKLIVPCTCSRCGLTLGLTSIEYRHAPTYSWRHFPYH